MLSNKKRQGNPYNTEITASKLDSKQQLKGQTPPPVRVSGSVKNSKDLKVTRHIWRQLFHYLNSHGQLGTSVAGRTALLKIVKSNSLEGKLERRKILLPATPYSRNWDKAEQRLILACEILVADLSKNLGGAA